MEKFAKVTEMAVVLSDDYVRFTGDTFYGHWHLAVSDCEFGDFNFNYSFMFENHCPADGYHYPNSNDLGHLAYGIPLTIYSFLLIFYALNLKPPFITPFRWKCIDSFCGALVGLIFALSVLQDSIANHWPDRQVMHVGLGTLGCEFGLFDWVLIWIFAKQNNTTIKKLFMESKSNDVPKTFAWGVMLILSGIMFSGHEQDNNFTQSVHTMFAISSVSFGCLRLATNWNESLTIFCAGIGFYAALILQSMSETPIAFFGILFDYQPLPYVIWLGVYTLLGFILLLSIPFLFNSPIVWKYKDNEEVASNKDLDDEQQ